MQIRLEVFAQRRKHNFIDRGN